MSAFSQLIEKAMNQGADPIKAMTGKDYMGHTQTPNPLYQAVGGRHASAAAGGEQRMGTMPTFLSGIATEVAEGIGNEKGFMGHMQDPDTKQDLLANTIGQIDQARWLPNKIKAMLMNVMVPAALANKGRNHPLGQ